MELAAFIIAAAAFFLYAFLFSIECGAPLLILFPEFPKDPELVLNYLGPIWETTNVFLIFGIVAVLAFFPGSVAAWGPSLIFVFFAFLALMGIRAIGMLLVFYHKSKDVVIRWIFAIASLLAPGVFFAGVFPYFFGGYAPFSPESFPLALVSGLLAMSLSVFISMSFFEWVRARRAAVPWSGPAGRILKISFAIFAWMFFVAEAVFKYSLPWFSDEPASYVWLVVAILLALDYILIFRSRVKRAAGLRAGFALLTVLVIFSGLIAVQFPYLIYPGITVYQAFTGASVAVPLFIAFVCGMALIIPSLAMLYYFFVIKRVSR